MAAAQEVVTKKQVMRYATEQLHAVRPQPPGIPGMLSALESAIDGAAEAAVAESMEGPPKDVGEAISRIEKMTSKLEHPPKDKPNLAEIAKTAPQSSTVVGDNLAKGSKVRA